MKTDHQMYYLLNPDRSGNPSGPYSVNQLRAMLRDGLISQWHLIAKDGDAEWVSIGKLWVADIAAGKLHHAPTLKSNKIEKTLPSFVASSNASLIKRTLAYMRSHPRVAISIGLICISSFCAAPILLKNESGSGLFSGKSSDVVLDELDYSDFGASFSQGKYGNNPAKLGAALYGMHSVLYLHLHQKMLENKEPDSDIVKRTALLAVFSTLEANALLGDASTSQEDRLLISEAILKGLGSQQALANAYRECRGTMSKLSNREIKNAAKSFCKAVSNAGYVLPLDSEELASKCL